MGSVFSKLELYRVEPGGTRENQREPEGTRGNQREPRGTRRAKKDFSSQGGRVSNRNQREPEGTTGNQTSQKGLLVAGGSGLQTDPWPSGENQPFLVKGNPKAYA